MFLRDGATAQVPECRRPQVHLPCRIVNGVRAPRWVLGVTALTLAACGRSQEPNEADGAEWALSAPIVVAGGERAGDPPLGAVTAIALNRAGTLAVADGSNNRILFSDSTGALRAVFGREGRGPGEFGRLTGLAACADGSFVAADYGTKVVQLSANGGFVREHPTEWAYGDLIGCLTTDTLLILRTVGGLPFVGSGLHRRPATIVRWVVSHDRVDTLARTAGTEYFYSRRGPYYLDLPLGAATVAAATATRLIIAQTDTAEVRVYDVNGQLLQRPSLPLKRVPLSRERFGQAVSERLARIPVASTRAIVAPIRDELPQPSHFPFFDTMVADDSGRVWLRTFVEARAGMRQWAVYAENVWKGEAIHTPEELDVHAIRGRTLVGVVRRDGESDVVARYELIRRRP
jgi:hypothetical protein